MEIVKIKWRDSTEVTGWQDVDDIKPQSPALCITVGVLWEEGKESVKVIQSIAFHKRKDDRQIMSMFIIPRGCVERIEKLGEVNCA